MSILRKECHNGRIRRKHGASNYPVLSQVIIGYKLCVDNLWSHSIIHKKLKILVYVKATELPSQL